MLRGKTPKDLIIDRVARIVHTYVIHTPDCSRLNRRMGDVFENSAVLLCDPYSKVADTAPLVKGP